MQGHVSAFLVELNLRIKWFKYQKSPLGCTHTGVGGWVRPGPLESRWVDEGGEVLRPAQQFG